VSVRALIVEDDADLAQILSLYLRREQIAHEHVSDGPSAWARFSAEPPDLVLLDLNLPGIDGVELCRRMRRAEPDVAIVMVTARDSEIDELLGLEVGADDYVTKPLSPRVLMARVRSLLRRRAGPGADLPPTIEAGSLTIDVERREVHVDGAPIPPLRPKEFELLCALAQRPGRVLGKPQLEQALYGYDALVGSRAIDQHVANLRKKLPRDAMVRTVRGIGYSLAP
jgi:DNA-binding response OmpR family regulator